VNYGESKRIWEEAVVVLMDVSSWHLPGGTEEDYEKTQFGVPEEC
jgi:hypothetical protein